MTIILRLRIPYPFLTRRSAILLIILFVFYAHTNNADGIGCPSSSLTKFNVGYQVLDLKRQKDGREQVLTVAVWYPTVAQSKSYNYGGPVNGKVALDAKPLSEAGPYPLLVFSHGYGGSGIGAVFLTEALASRGWIVACPDHNDRDSAVRIRTGAVKNFDRLGLLKQGDSMIMRYITETVSDAFGQSKEKQQTKKNALQRTLIPRGAKV